MAVAAEITLPSLDARSVEILAGIRRAFEEKGFDGASMQDLARAAGMSVGNFYRYFPSKAAIVEAFITHDLVEVESEFAAVRASENPLDQLRVALERKVRHGICDGDDGRLWAEIQAAAQRKPEIRAISLRMEELILRHLTHAFALATGLSAEEAFKRYQAQAKLMILLIKGLAMQTPDPADRDPALMNLVLRTLNRTLDEIASDAAKG